MALKEFHGKVSYADPVSGYGYVLAEDANDPADAYLFTAEDVEADKFEVLVPGAQVTFNADPDLGDGAAQDVVPL